MRKFTFAISLIIVLSPVLHAQQVGVGTSNPVMKLHVSNTDSSVLLLENTHTLSSGVSNALYFKTGSYFTGALKTTGQGSATASLGLYAYSASNANNLREYLTIRDNGNVGIGIDTPGYRLDVNGRIRLRFNGSSAGMWLNKADNSDETAFVGNYNDSIYGVYTNYGGGWQFFFDHKNGRLGMNTANPKVGISFPAVLGKKISLYPGATGDAGFGVYGNELRIHSDLVNADITFGYDNYTNGFTERMRVKGDGRVCIGTTGPATGYLLSVGGKIATEEVRVQLEGSWPDYVFSEKYKLPELATVKEYITQHKHLPDMPAASEIEKNGLEVGDMQKKMMEKIEQLTLYVLDLQQQITDLKAKTNDNK